MTQREMVLEAALREVAAYFNALDAMQPDRDHGTVGARVREVTRAAIARAEGK
jgi:hypothetical protein